MTSLTAILHHPKKVKSQPPFLAKNLRRVQLANHSRTLQMGAQLSSKTSDPRPLKPSRERDQVEESEDDDDVNPRPPPKRRRTDALTAFTEEQEGRDEDEEARPAKKRNRLVEVVNGSRFALPFQKSAPSTPAAKPPDWSINHLLPREPRDFEGGLVVDICGIRFTKPDSVELSLSDIQNGPLEIICSCSVSIKCRISKKAWQERCQYRKQFTLLITSYDNEIERGFIYPEDGGFVFLPKDLYVNRRSRGGRRDNGDLEQVFDLADEYRAYITIERVGFHRSWPLLDIPPLKGGPDMSVSRALDSGEASLKDLSLYCMTPLEEPAQQKRSHPLQICYEDYKQSINYMLELRVQWSLPNSATPIVSKIPRCEPPIPLPLSRPTASPAKRTREESLALQSAANRSQRQRVSVPTYNLKSLSAQAQGRSPRKSRHVQPRHRQQSRDGRTRSPSPVGGRDGITVSYSLGRADAADIGVKQQSVFPGLDCPFCYYPSRTFELLRVHLCNAHGNFKFSFRKPPPRAAFFVDLVKSRPAPASERWKTLQIGRPRTLFDFEKYLNGDDSWTESRFGPQHNARSEYHQDPISLSSSSSPQGTQQSSPTTSAILDDVEFSLPKVMSMRPKVPVPETPRPVFHHITKSLLKPGDDIPSSDEDETWCEQRHRDVVNDFTDLTDFEKEYSNRWNPFITSRGDTTPLTVPAHLPAAMVQFVRLNKQWLNEKRRKREFTMHCQALVMRGIIKDEHFTECMDILKHEAKRMEARVDMVVEEETPLEKPREKQDCICLKPAGMTHNVVCKGKECNVSFLSIFYKNLLIAIAVSFLPPRMCEEIRTTY